MALFLIYASVVGLAIAPAPVCAAPRIGPINVAQFFVEPVKTAARDTLVTARLCLVPPRSGVGSYQATLAFDSTVMRVVRVELSNGMQAKNATVPGVIRLAGAAPAGFTRGPLATLAFKAKHGAVLGKIRLTLREVNSISGVTLLANTTVSGHPSTDRTLGVIEKPAKPGTVARHPSPIVAIAVPRIDSISPTGASIDPESVVEVTLYGSGFAEGDVVLFDAAAVQRPVAEEGGTILRFIVPTMIPAHDGVQPHRVEAGRLSVKVRSADGTSNAVMFTVRGGDR
jgi:hypothetical protein